MSTYNSTSPYYLTGINEFYLDVMVNRPIPKESDDQVIVINQTYQYRPDLLAFDLYNNAGLWWVFYQRNPNTLTKPPFDFSPGKTIFLPKISTLKTVLGF
jgi:hypothetical protein